MDSFFAQPVLSGRVALITGVSRRRGIGFAIAKRLIDLGANVLIHSWAGHDQEQPWGSDGDPERLADELRTPDSPFRHLSLDLVDPGAPAHVVEWANSTAGHVDILVVNHARSSAQTLEELTAGELDVTFQVNCRASLLLIKEWAAQHDSREGGRAILMTSGQHLAPMPSELPYALSKGALHQVTASLAAHLAPRGITVNTVNPGPTDTGWADERTRRLVLERMPFGRWGQPDDAARLIAWLATDEARWITGQVINSEGGFIRQ